MQFPDILRTFIMESKSLCPCLQWQCFGLCQTLPPPTLYSFRSFQDILKTWSSRLSENTTTVSKAISGSLSGEMEKKKNRILSFRMFYNPLLHLNPGYHLQKSFSLLKM